MVILNNFFFRNIQMNFVIKTILDKKNNLSITCLEATKSRITILFCYQNYSDLLWEKNWYSDQEKLLKFTPEGREFATFLRSLTIYSNSER